MALMKREKLIKIAAIVVMGGSLVYNGFHLYNRGLDDFKQQASAAFDKSLTKELIKRSVNDSLATVRHWSDLSKIGEIPSVVFIDWGKGRLEYKMSIVKHQLNVTQDVNVRMLHSAALQGKPLVPDTLSQVWQQILKGMHLTAETAIQISVSDGKRHMETLLSTDYNRFASLTPSFTCYLGYGSEVEVVGFINTPQCSIFLRYAGIHILVLFAIGAFLYLFICYLLKKLRPSVVLKEVLVPQLVKDLPEGVDRIYRLQENVFFNANQGVLIIDGEERKFRNQATRLFELFLIAENHELSDAAIMEQLWAKGSETSDKLQQSITRLRNSLVVIPSIHIDRLSNYGYKLYINSLDVKTNNRDELGVF